MSKREIRPGFLGVIDWVKYAVVLALLAVLMLLVAVTTVELLIRIVTHLIEGIGTMSFGEYFLEEAALLDFVGFVLTIFIVIELAESVEVYLTENDFHGEMVVLVALIAVARKIILLEYDKYDPLVYVGIALIVAALAWAYWMLKRSHGTVSVPYSDDSRDLLPREPEPSE